MSQLAASPSHRRQSLRHSGSKKLDAEALEQKIAAIRSQQRDRRKQITLRRHPLKTLGYFILVLRGHVQWLLQQVLHRHRTISLLSLLIGIIYAAGLYIESPLQEPLSSSWTALSIAGWWVLLGFLSSFGLGTGLHTFVLYLGPFIASATLAATECSRTDFDKYGANRFVCAEKGTEMPTFFELWKLIAVEAFLWGAGTAIGELPPYFVARAARLAGERLKEAGGGDSDDESGSDDDLSEIASVTSRSPSPTGAAGPDAGNGSKKKQKNGLFDRAKRNVIAWLGHIGFLGILLFASIPNPLFDLAGLTCGHMLVPFATFFSATLIGKAVVKVNLQTFFIISVFNKDILEYLVKFIDANIPFAAGKVKSMFDNTRQQFHRKIGEAAPTDPGADGKGIAVLWDIFLGLMIAYFIMSIIDSSVQEYLVNEDESKIEQYRLEHEKQQ